MLWMFVKFPPLIHPLCFSLHPQGLRRRHGRQFGRRPPTLPRAGVGHIRLANGEREEGCCAWVGKAKGRRGAIGRGCKPGPQQPRPKPTRRRCWTIVGSRGRGQHLAPSPIFLRHVQAFLLDNQVCLLRYRNIRGGIYLLQLDGSQWTESKQSLVLIKVAPAKGQSHAFRLQTSLRTIHKSVLDSGRHPWSSPKATTQEGRTPFNQDSSVKRDWHVS